MNALSHRFVPVAAEFIIMLGEKNDTLEGFKSALAKNGAEFPVSR